MKCLCVCVVGFVFVVVWGRGWLKSSFKRKVDSNKRKVDSKSKVKKKPKM